MRTSEILGVAADRASREFAPTRDDLLNAQLGIEVDRLALGDQEWLLGRWGRMKIEEVVASLEKWLELNREYSEKWPNITSKKEALPEADQFRDEKEKFKKFFMPEPGEGD